MSARAFCPEHGTVAVHGVAVGRAGTLEARCPECGGVAVVRQDPDPREGSGLRAARILRAQLTLGTLQQRFAADLAGRPDPKWLAARWRELALALADAEAMHLEMVRGGRAA